MLNAYISGTVPSKMPWDLPLLRLFEHSLQFQSIVLFAPAIGSWNQVMLIMQKKGFVVECSIRRTKDPPEPSTLSLEHQGVSL
jgi:hypothetical protein